MTKSKKSSKRKISGKNIAKYYGILKDDKEYNKIMADIRKRWNNFNKK